MGALKITDMSKDELLHYFELWARGRKNVEEIKAELLRRLGAAVSAPPQPRFLDWVREKHPVLQNPILLNYGDSLTSNNMKGIDCATIVEEYAAQFFAAAPAQEPPPDLLVQDLAMLVRRLLRKHPNLELVAQAKDFLMRKGLQGSILRTAAQEQPVENRCIEGCPASEGRLHLLSCPNNPFYIAEQPTER